MKITLFQSDKGDCLLLRGEDGSHMLVDGGMKTSYTDHVAPRLAQLRDEGKRIDLVYVSHIDRDHVFGVLQMLDDMVDWRVFEFQRSQGNTHFKEPKSKRPPDVDKIWHNAFHELVGKNSGPIESMLAASAAILSGASLEELREASVAQAELAASVGDAIQLSRRIGKEQLGIPLNPEYDHKLMFVRDDQPEIKLGGMSIFVIGPFRKDLRNLRTEWNCWLRKNQKELERIRRAAQATEADLKNEDVERVIAPFLVQAEELGNRGEVTTPNLASLMVLVEEGARRILLTGDGHHSDIINGLKRHGKLDGSGRIHVDVLKVPHHGSEHNVDQDFCNAVTADHYIFCGNGAHHNPELPVLRAFVDSRRNDERDFKFWFSSSSAVPGNATNQDHMRGVEQLVESLKVEIGPRMKSQFLSDSFLELAV